MGWVSPSNTVNNEILSDQCFFLASEQVLFLLENSTNFSNKIGSCLEWQSFFALGGQNVDTEIFLLEFWFSSMKERYRLLGETELSTHSRQHQQFVSWLLLPSQAAAETNEPSKFWPWTLYKMSFIPWIKHIVNGGCTLKTLISLVFFTFSFFCTFCCLVCRIPPK